MQVWAQERTCTQVGRKISLCVEKETGHSPSNEIYQAYTLCIGHNSMCLEYINKISNDNYRDYVLTGEKKKPKF